MKQKRNIPWTEVVTVSNNHTDWFRFMHETKQWVRVIQRGGGDFPEELYLELHPSELYDVNTDWSNTRNALVKKTTDFGNPSYYHHRLPEKVFKQMQLQLGDRFTNILMNFDFIKRNKNGRDLIRSAKTMIANNPLFNDGVPLAFLGAALLSNKDHALLLGGLSEYYGSYNKVEKREVITEVEATGLAYAFKRALENA